MVDYQPIGERVLVPIEAPSIVQELDDWLAAHPKATVEETINFAQSYSTQHIQYTLKHCSTNPNTVLLTRQSTNCVGYAAVFHAVMTCFLAQQGRSSSVKSTHHVAHLYIGRFNLNTLVPHPAFKDHDFNSVTDTQTQKRYYVDPTVAASLGIYSVRLKTGN